MILTFHERILFQIKYSNLRNILIIFIIFFSIFINIKDEKSYLVSKPNPENVLKDILKSDIRKIYIENNLTNFIKDRFILSETNKKIEDYDLDYLIIKEIKRSLLLFTKKLNFRILSKKLLIIIIVRSI